MNLKEELSKPRSKYHAAQIIAYIGYESDQFKELISVFFGNYNRATQYAAYILSHIVDKRQDMLVPYVGKMINNLKVNPDVAIRRNTVRLLQNQNIPEEFQGALVEKCFEYLLSAKEPVTVKAFSMSILGNMAVKYPDLKNELKIIIEELMLHGSAGIISRGKRVLKQLDSID